MSGYRVFRIINQGKGAITTVNPSNLKEVGRSSNNLRRGAYEYYTNTNFSISDVKLEMEENGYEFNDCHIFVMNENNNLTCEIDLETSGIIFTISRCGTGSISFTSTRTLDTGLESTSVMNGNESSMALVHLCTDTDFLTIKNR